MPSWILVSRAKTEQWRGIKEFPQMHIVNLSTSAKSRILDQTLHEASVRRIEELERPKEQAPEEEVGPAAAPSFVRPLQGSIQANEGDNIFLEAQYLPLDDNTLTHEWLFNGQPLQKGHRFIHGQDFGFISLNILYLVSTICSSSSCIWLDFSILKILVNM